jgi:hypothetical protein
LTAIDTKTRIWTERGTAGHTFSFRGRQGLAALVAKARVGFVLGAASRANDFVFSRSTLQEMPALFAKAGVGPILKTTV